MDHNVTVIGASASLFSCPTTQPSPCLSSHFNLVLSHDFPAIQELYCIRSTYFICYHRRLILFLNLFLSDLCIFYYTDNNYIHIDNNYIHILYQKETQLIH